MTILQLPETHPAERRMNKTLGTAFGSYGALLRDPVFTGLSVVSGFGLATFFVFIGSAPFVYIEHYGLTPHAVQPGFALNAASFCHEPTHCAPQRARFGLRR
jgi:DHA1 family bicyclomycin/chloramphenicol resistance-like MFS transporter